MTALPPLLYESHMHTPLCGHAYGRPGEYAAVAEKLGFKGIIVTCHAPMPDEYSEHIRMRIEEFDLYVEMVQEAADEWRGRVDVRLGLESEYVPGFESWIEELHQRAHFHHVLGSVHQHAGEYLQTYFRGDWVDFQRTYFRHLAEAAESGLYDTISHPDLVKNQNPREWNRERVMDDIRRTLDRIAAAGTAMELNTSGRNKVSREMNPGPEILAEMCARNIPVVLGADAHEPRRVGDYYVEALRLLREIGYEEVSFFLDRKRQAVRIEDALASLEQPILRRSVNGSQGGVSLHLPDLRDGASSVDGKRRAHAAFITGNARWVILGGVGTRLPTLTWNSLTRGIQLPVVRGLPVLNARSTLSIN